MFENVMFLVSEYRFIFRHVSKYKIIFRHACRSIGRQHKHNYETSLASRKVTMAKLISAVRTKQNAAEDNQVKTEGGGVRHKLKHE